MRNSLIPTDLILVVNVDDESEGPGAESLVRHKAVLEGSLSLGLHHTVERHGRELQNQKYCCSTNQISNSIIKILKVQGVHTYI
jgi:hypothetical protein